MRVVSVDGVLGYRRVSPACFPSREQQTVVPQSTQGILLAGSRHENQPPFCNHGPPPRIAMFMRGGEANSWATAGEWSSAARPL